MLKLVEERGGNDFEREFAVGVRSAKTPETAPTAQTVAPKPNTSVAVLHKRKHCFAVAVTRRG